MEHHSYVSANGVRTFVYHEGEGPPIVMLHGMAATAECWRLTFDALKGDYTVIAPDLPGHGKSEGNLHPYSLNFYRDWLYALLDAFEMEHATLMANSMGGAISLAFTKAHPERVDRLILADPLGVSGHIPWDSGWRLFQRLPQLIGLALTGRIDPFFFRYLEGRIVKDPNGRQREVLHRMAEESIEGGVWPLVAGLRLLLVDFLPWRKRKGFTSRLKTITAPTLITWGKYDGLLPVRNATEAKSHMPDARVRFFYDSAHMPMLEEPDHFEELVREFIVYTTEEPERDLSREA